MAWTDESPMPFGKHKGKKLSEVPASYLLWCYDQPGMNNNWPQLLSYIEDNLETLTDQKVEEDEERKERYRDEDRY
jgi:uncharacterized protein (DUF3820 family)